MRSHSTNKVLWDFTLYYIIMVITSQGISKIVLVVAIRELVSVDDVGWTLLEVIQQNIEIFLFVFPISDHTEKRICGSEPIYFRYGTRIKLIVPLPLAAAL